MNKMFGTKHCASCGQDYDAALGKCPRCHADAPDCESRSVKSFEMMSPLGWKKELFLLLIAALGLSIVATIVQFLLVEILHHAYVQIGYSQAAAEIEIQKFVESGFGLATIDFPAYLAVFFAILVLLRKDFSAIWAKIKTWKTFIGFAFGIGLILISLAYNKIAEVAGAPAPSNDNQKAIGDMVASFPLLSIVILGLVGPFTEEAAYRLGLFGLLKRTSTALAYAVCGLVFGLIHLNFRNLGSAAEWIYLPNYIIAGLVLCVAYEKFGLGASYIAHATNNLFGVILMVIENAAGGVQ